MFEQKNKPQPPPTPTLAGRVLGNFFDFQNTYVNGQGVDERLKQMQAERAADAARHAASVTEHQSSDNSQKTG